MPYNLASHVSFSEGNSVYVIGGSALTGYSHSNIVSSNVDSSGALSGWVDVGSLSTAPIWHVVVKNNNKYMYWAVEKKILALLMILFQRYIQAT